jgi:hypothetical protein
MARSRLSNLPIRIAAGAFIVNSGLSKLKAGRETAEQLHGFARGAYPQVEGLPPDRFAKLLGATEIAVGGTLLMPFVFGDAVAGAALSAFSGGLLGLYARTPGMHQESSLRPTPDGLALAKDSWLAGIGLTLLGGGVGQRRVRRIERKAQRATEKARQAEDSAKKGKGKRRDKGGSALKGGAKAAAAAMAWEKAREGLARAEGGAAGVTGKVAEGARRALDLAA